MALYALSVVIRPVQIAVIADRYPKAKPVIAIGSPIWPMTIAVAVMVPVITIISVIAGIVVARVMVPF